MTIEEDQARYVRAAHAMQSGVRLKMSRAGVPDDEELWPGETSPKHLRVGVNAAMSDLGALVRLLISKGLFTQEEYTEAIADAMEDEQHSYEAEFGVQFG
jgi:hypothetical protein